MNRTKECLWGMSANLAEILRAWLAARDFCKPGNKFADALCREPEVHVIADWRVRKNEPPHAASLGKHVVKTQARVCGATVTRLALRESDRLSLWMDFD